MKKRKSTNNMLLNMGIRLSHILFVGFLFMPIICGGQEFDLSYGEMHNNDFMFRNFKRGLNVVESDGSLLLHSEPIFEDVRYEKGFNLAAVSIPINSVDSTNHFHKHRLIWLCINKELEPVFVFPSNTRDVQIDTSLCLFLFTDKVSSSGHWYREGAIDYSGNVLLEPLFSMIQRNSDSIFAVGADSLNNGEPPTFDRIIVVKNILEGNTISVCFKDENPLSDFADSIQLYQFNQAWELLCIQDLANAKKAFRLSKKGNDENLKKASQYNVKAISKLKRLSRTLIKSIVR